MAKAKKASEIIKYLIVRTRKTWGWVEKSNESLVDLKDNMSTLSNLILLIEDIKKAKHSFSKIGIHSRNIVSVEPSYIVGNHHSVRVTISSDFTVIIKVSRSSKKYIDNSQSNTLYAVLKLLNSKKKKLQKQIDRLESYILL